MHKSNNQTHHRLYKVSILGAECTGKSTLCRDLAHHFNTICVGEYMRSYLQNKPAGYICQYDDLLPIAIGQMTHEIHQSQFAHRYLFCDTSVFEIMTYAYWYFNDCPNEIIAMVKQSNYDLILLTDDKGITWQADGMRDLPHGREAMRAFFIKHLDNHGLTYHHISGDKQSRINQVERLLKDLAIK